MTALDVKELATFLGLAVMMIGFMLLGYHKGRRDERFDKRYCCSDCGDMRDDDIDGMCRSCRRQYYGEMSQG